MKSALGSLVLLSLLACGVTPSSTGTTEQPIVEGQQSVAADDAVVLLAGEGLCTGTLVAPNLVLTARHCVAEIDENSECGTFGADFAPSSIAVLTGVHPDLEDQDAAVAFGKKLFHEASDDGCSTDIAFILLDQPVPNARIAQVRLTAATVGEAARTIGYGEDGKRGGNLTDGRFERDGLTVDGVGEQSVVYTTEGGRSIDVDLASGEIMTGESTCFGDSGGPLFDATGAVIAVTSRGIDGSCIDRPSIYSAVATHVTLVETAFAAAGAALPDAEAPDAGGSSSSSSSSSSSGALEEEPIEADAGGSSGEVLRDASNDSDGGCSTTPGAVGSSVLWGLLGLVFVRRRRVA